MQEGLRVFLRATLAETETPGHRRQHAMRENVGLAIAAEVQFIAQALQKLVRLAGPRPFCRRDLVLLQHLLHSLSRIEGLGDPACKVKITQAAFGFLDVGLLNECCAPLAQVAIFDRAEHLVHDRFSIAFDRLTKFLFKLFVMLLAAH